ncbi:MAG: zinc ribbon domain-containing protein [Anaerolineae bacterium]|nr:MAG: zinc ribbon domain-containing protein [Anaerolineae bacterium]
MPNYHYECRECGVEFDRFFHFDEDPDRVDCPNGHSPVTRTYSAPPVVFKGSGYYITDHRPVQRSSSS